MKPDFAGLVGRSDAIRKVYRRIRRFADSPMPIVLIGETGTGKELCARAIWREYGRKRPFVPVNCAAIPESLVDSRLFGHEKGAFTGATRARDGLVSRAHGGILFLDEIMELEGEVQARLLRTLEEGEYRKVGGERPLRSRFRLVAATKEDPAKLTRRGRFRKDFFHRLGLLRIRIPPLRQRKSDIPRLARYFLQRYRKRCGRRRPTSFRENALALLQQPAWEGNVRQLLNVVEASAAVTAGEQVEREAVLEFLPVRVPGGPVSPYAHADELPTLEEAVIHAEKRAITAALARTGGNKLEAAKLLDVSESTLHRKISRIRDTSSAPALDTASVPAAGTQN